MQAGGRGGRDQLVQRGHELGHFQVGGHAGQAVIARSDNAQQLAVGGAVRGDGNGRMAGAGFQVQHIGQRGFRRQVGIARDKALFVRLDAADHVGLLLNGLGTIDKGNAALLGQRNGELLARNALHDGRDHRDVHFQRAFFLPFAELDQWGAQADRVGHIGRRGIPRHQQILPKRAGRLGKIVRHKYSPSFTQQQDPRHLRGRPACAWPDVCSLLYHIHRKTAKFLVKIFCRLRCKKLWILPGRPRKSMTLPRTQKNLPPPKGAGGRP